MTHGPAPRCFNEWRDLARRDPERFESQRRAAVEAAIAQAPLERRDRLRRLQWRIDQVRDRHPDPMAACIALSRLMWQSLHGERGLIRAMEHLAQRWHGTASPGELPTATVIDLQRQRRLRS